MCDSADLDPFVILDDGFKVDVAFLNFSKAFDNCIFLRLLIDRVSLDYHGTTASRE